MKKVIYLDNAATTYPKPENVYKKMDEVNRTLCFNSGRGSYKGAKETAKIIDDTKTKLLKLINADSKYSLAFTPSITIALNQIIQGLNYNSSSVVYVSPYEHNAVVRTINLMQKKFKFTVEELPINSETLEIDLDKMKYLFSKKRPSYVFVNAISNVTGYILPFEEIFKEAHKYDVVTILDTAQALGLIEIDIKKIESDILAFTAHKSLYGPFGVAGIILNNNIHLNEVIVGGTGSDSLNLDMPSNYPEKLESSSKNIVAIAGLNAALNELDVKKTYSYEKELSNYLIDELRKIEEVELYLPEDTKRHIGVVSFNINSYESSDVGMILDEDYNIAVRTGYHCAPYIHKYLKNKNYLGTVRVGIGKFNTKDDIDELIRAIKEIIE